ncbi:MAG: hypothetical protein QOE44_2004, partial [Solirubrobacteraceae bacterium]|nr:hypothetical protein [Solirubrobacteraceae bacterium]
MRRLETGSLVAALGGLLLLISLFLDWFGPGLSAWDAFEVWDLVLAALGVAVVGVAAGELGWWGGPVPKVEILGLGVCALVVVAVALLNHPPAGLGSSVAGGAWAGLGGAVLMVAGGVMARLGVSVSFAVGPGSPGAPGPPAGVVGSPPGAGASRVSGAGASGVPGAGASRVPGAGASGVPGAGASGVPGAGASGIPGAAPPPGAGRSGPVGGAPRDAGRAGIPGPAPPPVPVPGAGRAPIGPARAFGRTGAPPAGPPPTGAPPTGAPPTGPPRADPAGGEAGSPDSGPPGRAGASGRPPRFSRDPAVAPEAGPPAGGGRRRWTRLRRPVEAAEDETEVTRLLPGGPDAERPPPGRPG